MWRDSEVVPTVKQAPPPSKVPDSSAGLIQQLLMLPAPPVFQDRAHIIETGTESYRFRRTAERRKPRASVTNESA
jgi:hypothetical protein